LNYAFCAHFIIDLCFQEKDKLQKIAESLNIKLTVRDLRHTDSKVQLQAVCGQWLPLAKAVLGKLWDLGLSQPWL
jgi:hypothetical protein